ncbi:MAG: hypothetical protein AB7L66_22045 [Gemmatimonadales bacterium]
MVAAFLLALQAAVAPRAAQRAPVTDTIPFARTIAQLSESGGYFDTDNLISNELSYLHVMGGIRARGARGGAYIGVGPDQNFSYIAAVRPDVAFIVDLRRDNQLLHLLFKSLFETSRNRLEFLCQLFGRPVPDNLTAWNGRPLADLIGYVDGLKADTLRHRRTHAALVERIRGYGLPLQPVDVTTLARFHDEFMRAGLDLRFTSYGRGPRSYYPTIRDLYREKDLAGRESSFLAAEDDYQFLRDLERRGRVIPVVGDFGGTGAFRGIARFLADRRLGVSLFYTSNVEFYLFRQQSFRRYVENVRALPWADSGLIVRSYFGGVMGQAHPQARPGYASVQLLQTIQAFLKDTERPESVSYLELVTRNLVDLKSP